MSQFPAPGPDRPLYEVDPAVHARNTVGTMALVAGILLLVVQLVGQALLFLGGIQASIHPVRAVLEIALALAATGLGIAGITRGQKTLPAGIGLGIGGSTLLLSLTNIAFGLLLQS